MSGWSDPYGGNDEFSFMDGYDSGYSGGDIQMAGDVVSRGVLYDSVLGLQNGSPVTWCYYTPFGNMNSPWTYVDTQIGHIGCEPTMSIPYPDLH
jgi:hypothetical protein